jgi:hypothetical protein
MFAELQARVTLLHIFATTQQLDWGFHAQED